MADIITSVAGDLRKKGGAEYAPFVYDEAWKYMASLNASRRELSGFELKERRDILFNAGHAYIFGLAVAADGKYDPDSKAKVPDEIENGWEWQSAHDMFSEEADGIALSATSDFLSVLNEDRTPPGIMPYALASFLNGFCRGRKLEHKSPVKKWALESGIGMALDHEPSDNEVALMAMAEVMPGFADEMVVIMGQVSDDEDEVGAAHEAFLDAILERACDFVQYSCQPENPTDIFDADVKHARACTYMYGFARGFSDFLLDCAPTSHAGARAVPSPLREHGAYERLGRYNAERLAGDPALLEQSQAFMEDWWATASGIEGAGDLPDASDPYWPIVACAYAEGRKYAAEHGYRKVPAAEKAEMLRIKGKRAFLLSPWEQNEMRMGIDEFEQDEHLKRSCEDNGDVVEVIALEMSAADEDWKENFLLLLDAFDLDPFDTLSALEDAMTVEMPSDEQLMGLSKIFDSLVADGMWSPDELSGYLAGSRLGKLIDEANRKVPHDMRVVKLTFSSAGKQGGQASEMGR